MDKQEDKRLTAVESQITEGFAVYCNISGCSGRTHHRDLSRGLRDLISILKDLPW